MCDNCWGNCLGNSDKWSFGCGLLCLVLLVSTFVYLVLQYYKWFVTVLVSSQQGAILWFTLCISILFALRKLASSYTRAFVSSKHRTTCIIVTDICRLGHSYTLVGALAVFSCVSLNFLTHTLSLTLGSTDIFGDSRNGTSVDGVRIKLTNYHPTHQQNQSVGHWTGE